jgi:hypothetical protein
MLTRLRRWQQWTLHAMLRHSSIRELRRHPASAGQMDQIPGTKRAVESEAVAR